MRTQYCLLAVASLAGSVALAGAEDTAYSIRFDPQEEVAMAVSAAPPHLQANAGAYVLGERGYEKIRDGDNGFNCLVERDGKNTIAPICFDREGSETLLPGMLRRAALVLSGSTMQAAAQQVESEYRSGKFKVPTSPGIAYMLSDDFCQRDPQTGEHKTLYPPHVMFYAPYMSNADLGLEPEQIGSTTHPWILNEGTAFAYIIVVPHS